MNKLAIKSPQTPLKKHDRSFKSAQLSPPLRPTGERPAWLGGSQQAVSHDVRWPSWLDGLADPAVLDGLAQPWWRMLPAAAEALFTTWRQRARVRRDLRQIDARSLRDAGIDPGMADFEAAQPFWKRPVVLRDTPQDRP